jgi:pimeloyl-ACP methyl ester carboxylesterase
LGSGFAAAVVGGGTAYELVEHGVLPGKQRLDELDGACSVPAPTLSFAPLGPSFSDQFFSRARGRSVGYTIAYPSGHQRGDRLSLIIVLHGYGDNHVTALKGITPAQAVALRLQKEPMALVTVDGGNGYWTPHPHDDPMAMVVEELIPMCQGLGLGRQPQQIKLMGISMGGFGALAIAENVPHLIHGVAAISPAIWTTYDQAHQANPNAFASRRTFDKYDVISHAEKLTGLPLRVAVGSDDPFFSGVKTFVEAVTHPEKVVFSSGCHSDSFFVAQEPPSIRFLSRFVVHL